MTAQIALITGANKGIGFETARALGGGMTVLVGARSADLGEKAARTLAAEGIDARSVRLDVTDAASVEAAAARVDREHGRLDILVNNAAITTTAASDPASSPPPSRVAADLVRAAFETNVVGVVAVTNAMLPLLRRSPAGRIVNVSSGLASLTWLTDPADPLDGPNLLPYNVSKSALNAVTVAYARELAGTRVKVNAAAPGFCATDLNGHTGHRTAAQGAAVIAGVAMIGEDGPSGAYLAEDGRLPW